MADEMQIFSERLKERAKEKGFSQEDIREKLNCSLPAVKKWYSGANYPNIETLIGLSKLLDCDLDYLIGRIDHKTHDNKFICEETGLSESALEYIKGLLPAEKSMLNELLSPESGLSTVLKIIFTARYESCSMDDLNGEQFGKADRELIEAVKKITTTEKENPLACFWSLEEPNNVIKKANLIQLELKGKLQATFQKMIDDFIPPVCPPDLQNNDMSSFIYKDSIEETYHNATYGLLDNELKGQAPQLAELNKNDHEKAVEKVINILKKYLSLNDKAARRMALEVLAPPVGERAYFSGGATVIKSDGAVCIEEQSPE